MSSISVADGSLEKQHVSKYPNLSLPRKDSASFRQTSRSSLQNQDNRSFQRTDSRESVVSSSQKINKRKDTTGISSTKLNDLSPYAFLFSHQKPYTGGTCPIRIIVNVKQLSFEEKLMNQSESKFTSLQITSPTTLLLTSPNDELKTKKIVSKEKIYSFEYVQDEQADNSLLYQRSISTSVQRFVSGVNQSILVLGGEGSGKQQTMVGTMRDPGLFMLALKEIFDILYESPSREQTTLKCSMYYNKGPHFYDLLVSHQYPLRLAERENGEPYPKGVSEVILTNMLTSLKILKIGLDKLDNDQTIRKEGNIILNFRCERNNSNPFISQDTYFSFLRIIKFSDAPFSEIAGQNIAESNILTNIENIARQLSQASKKKTWCQVSFRASVFTEYLRESLIGNSETSMVFCVSTSIQKVAETSQILRLAAMVGRISTNPQSQNIMNVTRIQRQYADSIDKITNAVTNWVKEMWGELEADKIKRLNKVLSVLVALENALNNLAHMNEQWLQMELLRNGMLGRALDLHCGLYSRSITSEEIKEFYIASLNRHASKQLQPKLASLNNPLAFTLHQQLINKVNLITASNSFASSFSNINSVNIGSSNLPTGITSMQSGSASVSATLAENKLLSQQATQRSQLKSTANSPALNSISASLPRSSQITQGINYQIPSKIYQQLPQPAAASLSSHAQHRSNNHSNAKINSSFTNLPPSLHNIDRSNSHHSAINSQNNLHTGNGGGGAATIPSVLAGQDFEKATALLRMLEKLQKCYENLLEHNIYIPQDVRKDIATALKEYKFLQKTLLEESANASEEIPQHHRNTRFSSRYFIAASKQASVRNSVFKIIHDGQQSEGGGSGVIDDMKPLRSITTEEDIPDAYEDEDSDDDGDDDEDNDDEEDQLSNEEGDYNYFQSSDQRQGRQHYKSIDPSYIKALQIKLGLTGRSKNKLFVNHTKLSIPLQAKQQFYPSHKLDSSIKDQYPISSQQSYPQFSNSDKRSISSSQMNLTGYQFRQEQVPEISQDSLGDNHARSKLKTMLQGQQKQIPKQEQDQNKTLLRFPGNQSFSQFMQNEEDNLIEKIFTSNTRYNSNFRSTKQKNYFNLNSPCFSSNNLSQNQHSTISKDNININDNAETTKNHNNTTSTQRNFFLLTQKPTATTTSSHKNTYEISSSTRQLLSMTNLNFFKPTGIPQQHARKFPKIINTLFSSNLQQLPSKSSSEKTNNC